MLADLLQSERTVWLRATKRTRQTPFGHYYKALSDVRPMPHSGGLSALAANYLKVLELLTHDSKGTVNDDD